MQHFIPSPALATSAAALQTNVTGLSDQGLKWRMGADVRMIPHATPHSIARFGHQRRSITNECNRIERYTD
jgi:hypothetical protein